MAMTVKEAVVSVRSKCGVAHAALLMAFATIAERIRNLPRQDQDDLYALMKSLPGADEETLEDIMTSAMEILEQAPGGALSIEKTVDETPGKGLVSWMAFVSQRIREVRKNAGLTQEDLAAKTGLPQSHISRLEAGKHSPSRSTLEKIAAALGVEVGEFDPSA